MYTPAARGSVQVFSVAAEEREEATFLGVETMPITSTLTAQLNLAKNTGLVVRQIVADSPAAGVLREDDVLVKFDDQILIETRQFAVLVRNKNAGDEVSLTYVRGGKQSVAKVKLVKREVPKLAAAFTEAMPFGFVTGQAVPGMPWEGGLPEARREQVDRMLTLIRPMPGTEPMRMRIEGDSRIGVQATRVNIANSTLIYNDEQGTLELTTKDGQKSLVAKDPQGAEQFSGSIATPEERNALPPGIRARLEKIEGMDNVTFRTDGDFRAAETTVVRPLPRGISFPTTAPRPVPSPLF